MLAWDVDVFFVKENHQSVDDGLVRGRRPCNRGTRRYIETSARLLLSRELNSNDLLKVCSLKAKLGYACSRIQRRFWRVK